MPTSAKKTLQLYRNETIFEPSNELTALQVAKQELSSQVLNDGEVLIARYQEENDEVKTVLAVAHVMNNVTGLTFFTEDTDEIVKVPYEQITPASSSQTIEPYKMYDLGVVSTPLTIIYDTSKEVSGYTKEYLIRFIAGSGCNIILPNGTLYPDGVTPSYVSGRTYEINVVNNCAVIGEFY